MQTSLDVLIAECIAAKTGDREFLLTYTDQWIAAIGNKSNHVPLGEAIAHTGDSADFIAEADDPVRAMELLLTAIRSNS